MPSIEVGVSKLTHSVGNVTNPPRKMPCLLSDKLTTRGWVTGTRARTCPSGGFKCDRNHTFLALQGQFEGKWSRKRKVGTLDATVNRKTPEVPSSPPNASDDLLRAPSGRPLHVHAETRTGYIIQAVVGGALRRPAWSVTAAAPPSGESTDLCEFAWRALRATRP